MAQYVGPICGSPSLPVTWSGSQVMEYITQLFPILSSLSFHYCSAVGSRLVRIPDHIRRATDLKTFFKEHRRARVSTVFMRLDIPPRSTYSMFYLHFTNLYKDLNETMNMTTKAESTLIFV